MTSAQGLKADCLSVFYFFFMLLHLMAKSWWLAVRGYISDTEPPSMLSGSVLMHPTVRSDGGGILLPRHPELEQALGIS